MDVLITWLPRVGAPLTIVLGLVGFFKPRLITDGRQITLESPMDLSGARVVFGGLHLGAVVSQPCCCRPRPFLRPWASPGYWVVRGDGQGGSMDPKQVFVRPG